MQDDKPCFVCHVMRSIQQAREAYVAEQEGDANAEVAGIGELYEVISKCLRNEPLNADEKEVAESAVDLLVSGLTRQPKDVTK